MTATDPGAKRTSGTTRGGRLDPDELAHLEEERDFLLRSLDDLDREQAAGDLDAEDHQALRDAYTARAAEVLHAIEEQRSLADAARRPRSAGRTLGVAAAVLAVAVLAGVLVAQASGERNPGQSATGETVPLSDDQQARRCLSLINQSPSDAITCLQDVLDRDPANATALTYMGWTLYLSSRSLPEDTQAQAREAARRFLDRAVEAAPRLADPLAFRAVIAEADGRVADAKADLDRLDALDVPAEIQSLTGPLRERVERAIREGGTTSSTSSTVPP